MENEKRIVEINGIKLEVDMRTAKTTKIQAYKIGDPVKVLKKEYNDQYKSYPGIIVNFEAFEESPTIVIAALTIEYSGATISFFYINKATKDIEICPAVPEELAFDKGDVIKRMDKEIAGKEAEISDLERKKTYFLKNFNKYFDEVIKAEGVAAAPPQE